MPKLPVVSGSDFVKALLKQGYEITNRRGDHVVLRRRVQDPSTAINVPLHRELKKGTLHSLLKRHEELTGMSPEDFLEKI